jgi:penicillin-binding protein 1A
VDLVNAANASINDATESNRVEGTLISIDNDTGAITALVGGSQFTQSNQFIRAVQARLQPGSTFKPLYYSAGIDSKEFTAVTPLNDSPRVFYSDNGVPYIPENYGGIYRGNIQLWRALALSLNIPSLIVLEGIGFEAAIERSVNLLGISKEELPSRAFDRVYPLGLGTCSVRPVEMARAFAIFSNGGREITPYAIRTIEDRNGRVIINVEQEMYAKNQAKGGAPQVISPQNAFIMNNFLQSSARMGTLSAAAKLGRLFTYKNARGQSYTLPVAGKTGTTQNWSDAWTIGSSPYLTTAVWFGFDKKGRSLGRNQTGAQLAGGAWAKYMYTANEDYAPRDFPRPQGGLAYTEVCSVSGQLLTPECGNFRTSQYFLAGTQPVVQCTLHRNMNSARTVMMERLEREHLGSGVGAFPEFSGASLDIDFSFLETGTENSPDSTFSLPAEGALEGLFPPYEPFYPPSFQEPLPDPALGLESLLSTENTTPPPIQPPLPELLLPEPVAPSENTTEEALFDEKPEGPADGM